MAMSPCESLTTKDKTWEEEEESKGNIGDEDDGYITRGNLIVTFALAIYPSATSPAIHLPATSVL